jgi:hypothetical protein
MAAYEHTSSKPLELLSWHAQLMRHRNAGVYAAQSIATMNGSALSLSALSSKDTSQTAALASLNHFTRSPSIYWHGELHV